MTSLLPLVLLAEDDPELRLLFAEALIRVGFRVEALADGRALDAYLSGCRPWGTLPQPVAVVSDLRLPGSTGLQVLERHAGMHLPWFIVSTFPESAVRERVERLGATMVDKPVELEAFARGLMAHV